ncbi:MAG: DUF1743 domain-containing protein [Methanomassiliicoccales archaeon]|nr:MAG: DUF1743 domain-containing protein [Methanomassiliicoccales archaeon]
MLAMTVYVGIDDTDSQTGMCTTYLASEIIKEFEEYDLIGYPRLVRLNPNIPWKTRGNGAICLHFGKGWGKKFPICRIGNKDYFAFERGNGNLSPDEFEEGVAKIVESHFMTDDRNTNPAFIIMSRKPTSSLYWRAVRGIVYLEDVKEMVSGNGIYRLYKNGRGLIGAASAVSWRPRDRTYEIITYRQGEKWGTQRTLKKSSVIAMDRKFKSTFNNYDYEEDSIAIAPNSPCPVLFGIRGDNPNDLVPAMSAIRGEKAQRWTIFLTNQGTDEHLVKRRIRDIAKNQSVIVDGTVVERPRRILGGHLIFRISDGDDVDCAAYEPSKNFREVVSHLREGDELTIYGSVRDKPRTVNVEKLQIHSLATIKKKQGNPECPQCGKRMKSAGSNAGYRCRKCHVHAKEGMAKRITVRRPISPGFYEPTVSARRHLSKPLKRIQN